MKQEEVRSKLVAHMMKTETGLIKMSKKIGLSEMTIASFVSKSKDVKISTLGKINNYLERISES